MHCINISHPDFKALQEDLNISSEVLKAKVSVWMDSNTAERFPTAEELNIAPGNVNATLKIIDALSKIQRGIFTQDKLQGWVNDLQKQGVSNQQIELFKDTVKPGMTKEDIAATIAANYSYTVEIKTAIDVESTWDMRAEPAPSKYYSNMTVPGGTNYTENEIATPAITPNIKGHAQFATNKGIGWFRSDDRQQFTNNNVSEESFNSKFTYNGNVYEDIDRGLDALSQTYKNGKEVKASEYEEARIAFIKAGIVTPKTRRILEVQSDLFQKGRNKQRLIGESNIQGATVNDSNKKLLVVKGDFGFELRYENGDPYLFAYEGIQTKESLQKIADEYNNTSKNQFLQLLNKDNNWVTFFVKSIIQDSAKKGYEKVLFPSGNTASKVEGHTTLEEFKKQKEDRIFKTLLPSIKSYKETLASGELNGKALTTNDVKDIERLIIEQENEVSQLKQELERVETEGFGALKPIYNFYENTVTNILRKQYGKENVKQITDEYGNTWNEVSVKSQPATSTIFYSKQNLNPFQKQAADIYWNHVYNKNLSDLRIEEINKALKEISDFIGDEQWTLQLSKNDKLYIAGYKNRNVLFENYYSPYANGMFRQMSTKTAEEKNTKLEKALFDWAKIHGISINALEVLIDKYKGRYETGILGVADFANAVIGLAENRKIDTLPEEVAHFAIELMANDPSMIRALETVDTTELYNIVKEEYKDVYTDEIDFRKEAVAKILAQEIISEFKSREDVPQSQRGFWTFLQAAAQKFVNWVRNNFNFNSEVRQDFEALVRPLAVSILDNQYLGEFGATETKAAEKLAYQLDPEEEVEKEEAEEPAIAKKKAFLNEVILQLSDRMSLLKRGAKSQIRINALETEISKLQYQLAKGELDLGIASFIKLAESEIRTIDDSLKNARLSRNINPTTLVLSENFMQMYENIFGNFIEAMYDENIPSEETEELRKMIHNLSVLINDARGINRMLMKKVTRDILEEANTDAYGNVIDPDFDPDIVSQDTHEDVSFWRLQVGNYKYADSKIIKSAHKIIFNSLANVKRFTAQKGNDLVRLQDQMFKSGGKIEDLIEIDKNGKYTHYFVQEYKWSEYYKAMNETKSQIAEALGFEDYNQIQKVFLTPDQLKLQKTLWGKFYSQHTAKKKITTDQGLPIDITVPNDSYKDPRFAQAMKNPATKAYYEELIRSKKEAVDKLPVQYRSNRVVYMVPPILKSTLDRLTNKEQSFLSRVAQLGREALFIDQDETQFGQLNVLNNKMVPIHFTRPLENLTDLSFDVARSVTLFSEMAENFQEMNKIAGPLGSLQYSLAERNYFTDKKGTQRKKGIESKEYETLETLLDTHVFGIERNALASAPIPENKVTKALGIEGKQFSWSKASQRFAGFIRNNNLALNFPTSLSGWLKGSGDSIIEDQIGLYTTNESKNWARVEFSMNLFDVLGQVGKTTQTNKMHLIMQENEVVDINKMLSDTTRNRATRTLLNRDLLYVTFATGDYGLKGRITLSIYDNYRLHNGQFMTRAKFFERTAAEKKVENNSAHQKEMSAKWKELREQSLYNAYEVIDGKLQIKPEFEKYINKTLLNSVKGKVDHVTTYIDGTLSKTDKGKLARTIAGDFLLMHRGWFIGLVDTRFKRESTNMLTEEQEIGTYRATLGFLYTAFYKTLIKDKAGLSASFATWNTLSPAKKRGVMKTGLDLLYLNIVAFLAALMNTAADEGDDDDWTLQFTAYQLNRLLLEQGSAWSPKELVQMIDEPVVGARMIKDLLDIKEAFNFDEVYEAGMYKDKSHGQKWWMKKLPTRNLYEMQYPELKNRFIKKMVDSEYYEAMTDEQKHSIGKKASFFEDLFPTGILSDPDDRPEVVTQVIEDLEEEQEEENGFN